MSVASQPGVRQAPFGQGASGEQIDCFTVRNARGTVARFIGLGAIIQAIHVHDRHGRMDDVVLGHDSLEGYLSRSPYFGAVVGRYGNRIANGRFPLDGREVQLAVNDGAHHLHGGRRGFDKAEWAGLPVERDGAPGVRFTHRSLDGDQGYPGTLTASVTYLLTDRNELVVEYLATTNRATPVNLTQHSYFNLAGQRAGDVLGHRLTVSASRYTPVDEALVPTGALAAVQGTPFDFRRPTAIGARVDDEHAQLRIAGGYDHNLVLDEAHRRDDGLVHAAHVEEPESGRTLDVHTTEPGLQVYSGNFLDGSIRGKGGAPYGHRAGVCLETQRFPDSPNHAHFPSAILRPGEQYRSRTIFTFGIAG